MATDQLTSTVYRVARKAPFELMVFPRGTRRSCDRSVHSSLAEAKKFAERRVEHDSEVVGLERVKRQSRAKTPWGIARHALDHGEGVILYSAAEQDGFYLPPLANAAMPDTLRIDDGWYHDDGDSARVVLGLPHLFTTLEHQDAVKAAKQAFPDLFKEWKQQAKAAVPA